MAVAVVVVVEEAVVGAVEESVMVWRGAVTVLKFLCVWLMPEGSMAWTMTFWAWVVVSVL